ncbi:MAG: MarR family transcriptional regulator [Candidatus Aminicenantes bacterium]|nr:MarR family transcriptional regulator [Candidatus Aminicenantes bacterium]
MEEQKIIKLREKLRILERESGGVFDGQADCCGVTMGQCHTLLEIGSRGEISLVDLADALGLDASTMSRTIQGLVLIGLVDRRSSDKDRRFVVIRLTDQGRKIFAEIETRYNAYFSRVSELLPEDRRESILESVGEFADAIKRLNTATGCCRKGQRP